MLKVSDIVNSSHALICGCSGSGKSVLTNTLVYNIASRSDCELVLIDNKGTEFKPYKLALNTLAYAVTPVACCEVLEWVLDEIMNRYISLEGDLFAREYKGKHLYVIIDELADLLTVTEIRKRALPVLQRIAQIGRASRVHLVMCTQSATKQTIGNVKNNVDCFVGLRVSTRQESKNVIGVNGCEMLTGYGKALCNYKGRIEKLEFTKVSDNDIRELLNI